MRWLSSIKFPRGSEALEWWLSSIRIFNSYSGMQKNLINIATDDFGGGYKMGRYLIKRGHKKIAMLADNDKTVDHNRWLGLCKAMQEKGLEISEKDHFIFSSSESVRNLQFEQLLESLTKYTALFVASDFYALEVCSFLQSKGVSIPHQISVAGFDDLIYAKLARPRLTTISQNISMKAQMAVEALIENEEINRKSKCMLNQLERVLEVELVERESVKNLSFV